MDSTAALACRLGYDFPRLAVEIAAGRHPDGPGAYAVGRYYHWIYGDLGAWRQRKIPWQVGVRSALRGYDLSFDWRDPMPGLHLLWCRLAHRLRSQVSQELRILPLRQSREPGARL
jgi:hypothetical protein